MFFCKECRQCRLFIATCRRGLLPPLSTNASPFALSQVMSGYVDTNKNTNSPWFEHFRSVADTGVWGLPKVNKDEKVWWLTHPRGPLFGGLTQGGYPSTRLPNSTLVHIFFVSKASQTRGSGGGSPQQIVTYSIPFFGPIWNTFTKY